jgi:hypothetical protein
VKRCKELDLLERFLGRGLQAPPFFVGSSKQELVALGWKGV